MKIIHKLSSSAKSTYFVTTPIYYVNAAPHIGHLYSSIITDAIQRWNKLKYSEQNVLFSTGTDEHGIKIQQAADNNKITINEYCDRTTNKYKELFETFNIDYTNFIRTTNPQHKIAVQHFWNKVNQNGHIYLSQYSGWYSIQDETFLSDSQLNEKVLPNGTKIKVSSESGHSVEWTEEVNYVFRLNNFQDDLKYWLRQNEHCVKPQKFHQILYELVDSDAMQDVSVSRPISRVHWGIPVPGDSRHSIYVWMDALVNYLTAAGYPDTESKKFKVSWPPDVQVIGKDILKFHGIYWPAFLIAAGLEPPRMLYCHSHWTIDGQKMSKSKNNVVCPINKKEMYTVDGIRYFLLREGVARSDGNYSDTKVTRILNSELADTLGNLLSRCTGAALNPNQEFPAFNIEVFQKLYNEDCTKNLIESLQKLPDIVYLNYNEFNFYKVVDCIISTMHTANLFFEMKKPWELKKSASLEELNMVLHLTLETLRITGIMLQPIIPTLCNELLNKINVPKNKRSWKDITPFSWESEIKIETRKISPETSILYKRIITGNKKQIRNRVR